MKGQVWPGFGNLAATSFLAWKGKPRSGWSGEERSRSKKVRHSVKKAGLGDANYGTATLPGLVVQKDAYVRIFQVRT